MLGSPPGRRARECAKASDENCALPLRWLRREAEGWRALLRVRGFNVGCRCRSPPRCLNTHLAGRFGLRLSVCPYSASRLRDAVPVTSRPALEGNLDGARDRCMFAAITHAGCSSAKLSLANIFHISSLSPHTLMPFSGRCRLHASSAAGPATRYAPRFSAGRWMRVESRLLSRTPPPSPHRVPRSA